MSASTQPIDPQWVVHTLTPYLRYAFQHVLRHNLDITPYVHIALNASSCNPDSSTDGDDLVFERVFFAIERRHQGLPADLNGLTENLEPLAQFLIRRAKVKGPYELLGRDSQPSDAWKKYESERLRWYAVEHAKAMQNQTVLRDYSALAPAHQPAPPASGLSTRPSATYHLIDPRLLYASPGQFAAPGLSGALTIPELQYYQRRNQEIEASIAMRLAALHNQQQGYGMQHLASGSQVIPQAYQQNVMFPDQQWHHDGTVNRTPLPYAPDSAFQQQFAPGHVPHLGQQQRVIPTQHAPPTFVPTAQMYASAQSTQHLLQQPGHLQPPGYPSRPPIQQIQQRPVPIASRPMPVQPVSASTSHDNNHRGLPTLTKPAGISKSIPKAPEIASLPAISDSAQLEASMAAFKKLSREEKIATLLELGRAQRAAKSNALTPMQKSSSQQVVDQTGAPGAGERKTKQNKKGVGNMLKPVAQQAITVAAPTYQTYQDASTTAPGVGGFAPHPGYLNVTSSFASPQFRGPSTILKPATPQEKK